MGLVSICLLSLPCDVICVREVFVVNPRAGTLSLTPLLFIVIRSSSWWVKEEMVGVLGSDGTALLTGNCYWSGSDDDERRLR
jgi:hypothetical protein